MGRQSARGHICIRRKAKDGDPGKTGNPGLTIRTTAWETGKEYRNDTTLDVSSVRYLDIVLDKPITVGVSNINAYLCLKTHTSSASIPLGHTTYWQKMNSLAPIVTALVLTQLLKAEHIDVNDLAANEAFIKKLVATALFTTQLTASEAFIEKLVASEFFIDELTADTAFLDNLYVKHLSAADGTFKGVVTVLNSLNKIIAKIGEADFPLWIGGESSADAVTKVSSDGELSTNKINAQGGKIADFTITDGQLKISANSKSISGATVYHYELDDGFVLGSTKSDNYQTVTTREVAYSPLDSTGSFHYISAVTTAKSGYTASKPVALWLNAATSNNYVHQNAWALYAEDGQFAGMRPAILCINSTTAGNANMGYAYMLHLSPNVECAHTIICRDLSRTRTIYLPTSAKEGDELEFVVLADITLATGGQSVLYSGRTVTTSISLANSTVWKLVYTKQMSGYPSGIWVMYKISG